MAIDRIQVRRDTPQGWVSTNPVLADGEPGFERGTGKIKYGDGITPWNSLPYASQGEPGEPGPPGPAGLAEDPDYPGLYTTTLSVSPDPSYPGLYTF
jgi:hypothetical protein